MKENIKIILTMFFGISLYIILTIQDKNRLYKEIEFLKINSITDSTFLMKCIQSKDSTIEAQEKQIKNLKATKICKVSYYAYPFHGRKTASGKIYNMYDYTCAAINSIKLGTILKVTNIKNGKSIIVKANDRGDFAKYGITLDLSYAAFIAIGIKKDGILTCKIEIV